MQKRRNVQKHFEISEYENRVLQALVKKTGFSTEANVIRHLIMGAQLTAAPGPEFYRAMGEIRKIGININQIARMAHEIGFIDAAGLAEYKKQLDIRLAEIKKIVLEPQKIRDINVIIKDMEYMLWDTEEEQKKCWRLMGELENLIGMKKEGCENGGYEDMADTQRGERTGGD